MKTFTVRYKCCYGFKRQEGAPGCSKQVDLKPLINTLDDLNLKEFKQIIENANLEKNIKMKIIHCLYQLMKLSTITMRKWLKW